MLREYVKWDYELRTPAQLEAVVDRALEVMQAEPRGPVYLTLPREVLAASPGAMTISSPARRQVRSERFPDPARIDEAARILARAEYPIVLVSAAGIDPRAVDGTGRARRSGRHRRGGGGPDLPELPAPARSAPRLQRLRHHERLAGRGRRDHGRRGRRTVVSASEEACARRADHSSRRGSVLHALPDAQLSVRRADRRHARRGPAAADRGRAASRRSPGRGPPSRAPDRRAPRAPRGVGEDGTRAGERLDDRLRVGGALPGRDPRREHGGRERVPAGPPVRRVHAARAATSARRTRAAWASAWAPPWA